MTVSIINPVNMHTGNNSAEKFDFDFLIENPEELIVKHIDEFGVNKLLQNGIDYEIHEIGNKNGGYIKFPLETSKFKTLQYKEKILLTLSLPIKQESKFENSDNVLCENFERSLDYITRILQIMNSEINRSVKIEECTQITPEELVDNIKNYYEESKKHAETSKQKAEDANKSMELAKDWAIKLNEPVDEEEYSSKYYAKKSEEFANLADSKSEKANQTYETLIESIKEEGDKQLSNVKSAGLFISDGKLLYIDENGEEKKVQVNEDKKLFNIEFKDHKLSFEEKEGLELLGEYVYKESQDGRYGYPDFYERCLAEYNEGIENTEEIEGITIKIHSNGHKYYNISDKAKIDEIYSKDGVAWYYGVDEVNERILLPRNDYLLNLSGKIYGLSSNGKGIVLTNGVQYKNITTGNGAGMYFGDNDDGHAYNIGDKVSGGGFPTPTYTAWGFKEGGLNVDLSKNSKLQEIYIYQVVGNTQVTQSKTAVTQVSTTENDTLPLFTGMYFDFKPNHVSWLKAGTEASEKIYQSAYNKLLKISKGEETKYGEGFKIVAENQKLSDTDYSEYWIINEDEQTFRAPLTVAQITKSESTNLYFKVANAVENLEIIDAGEVMEALNNAVNKTECKAYIIDTYTNGNSGYRVYSNGYCEQWGYVETNKTSTVNTVSFLKTYKDSNYFFIQAQYSQGDDYVQRVQNKLPASIQVTGQNDSMGFNWLAMGYLSEGTY